jgi:hypothetical protein
MHPWGLASMADPSDVVADMTGSAVLRIVIDDDDFAKRVDLVKGTIDSGRQEPFVVVVEDYNVNSSRLDHRADLLA